MHQLQRIGLLALVLMGLITAGCNAFNLAVVNTAARFSSYDRSANHAYGTGNRQSLDVYSPKDKGDCPIVIFWYGGSWTSGQRDQYRFVGAALAQAGVVTVVPDYQLYPPAKFPAFVDDGAQAILWVQQHAREFGGNPDRIVLMGHSAGAHEAAFLAYDRERLVKAGVNPRGIVGLVGLSGPYALAPDTDVLNTIFASPYTERDWQPVRFVTAQSPPTFLAHGTADDVVSIKHAEKLRDVLKANGVRVETEFYPDKKHTDTIAGFSIPARHRVPVFEQTVKFVESVAGKCGATNAEQITSR
jgi:acetyl esterase/lipase